MGTVKIGYEVESTARGWIVWRHVDGKRGARGSRPCRSANEARDLVRSQIRADVAAATRLGVTVEHFLEGITV